MFVAKQKCRDILYCGNLTYGGTCRMRMLALERSGLSVYALDTNCERGMIHGTVFRGLKKCGILWDAVAANARLLDMAKQRRPSAVWIDKGLTIRRSTLVALKDMVPEVKLIHYSPDDMMQRHNQSLEYVKGIREYDLHVTTKSYNVSELRDAGARNVLFVNNAFCPQTHRQVEVTNDDIVRYGGAVGFIGAFEEDRARAMEAIADAGIPVRVWGPGWQGFRSRCGNIKVEKRALIGDDYVKAISCFGINLGFLRKMNRDQQTTRSVEIPACGGFLLAERTVEHQQLFAEGIEAEYFSTSEELVSKVKYYVARDERRREIAQRGAARCLREQYSYDGVIDKVMYAAGIFRGK